MTIAITRAAEGFARRAWTVADILNMVDAGIISEHEKFELIEGEIVPMSPKGNQHEVLKAALTRIMARHAPDDLRLAVETSLYLDDRTFVEPDLCLYPKRLLPKTVKGYDVVLAIEVAGSSLAYDRGLKANLYAKHGVQEFWVVQSRDRLTWVHRGPKLEGTWASVESISPEAEASPLALPSLAIRMADLD